MRERQEVMVVAEPQAAQVVEAWMASVRVMVERLVAIVGWAAAAVMRVVQWAEAVKGGAKLATAAVAAAMLPEGRNPGNLCQMRRHGLMTLGRHLHSFQTLHIHMCYCTC